MKYCKIGGKTKVKIERKKIMAMTGLFTIGFLLINLFLLVAGVILIILLIKALLKYLKTEEVRSEKAEVRKSLGEVLKAYRMERHMTQEFVADAIGVSRQAVSKWENGGSLR